MNFSRTFARWFPVPRILRPKTAGIDITDASVKWLSFDGVEKLRVASFGSIAIPAGVVERGAVKDPRALGEVLREVRTKHSVHFAHAALPEEDAYIFGMHVPFRSSRAEVNTMIEFELEGRVPIPAAQAVYDFDTVFVKDDNGEEIAVSVFPRDLAEGYVHAFREAGIELLSLEIEARSIARSVSERGHDVTTLLVDCGHARTGLAILKNGIPIFSSTIDIGGKHLTQAVIDALGISEEEARIFKNECGLVPGEKTKEKGREALESIAKQLGEEIARHYHFWDTRRNERGERVAPVERVFLVGGGAQLQGFPEYIAGMVHVTTEYPNVWRNALSFDTIIPQIDERASFQYATAIGLALRGT